MSGSSNSMDTDQSVESAKNEEGDGNITDLTNFTTEAFKNLVSVTRICNNFPEGDERALCLSQPEFGRQMEKHSQQMLGLINQVLKSENISGDLRRLQADEQLEIVQECNDILLERISTNLDIKAAKKANNSHVVVEAQVDVSSPGTIDNEKITTQDATTSRVGAGSWNRTSSSIDSPARSTISARLFTAKNIVRPQMQFKVPVDNSAQNAFRPRLTEKPNSLKPLALLPEYDDAGNVVSFLHPYEFELLKFEPLKEQLQKQNPQLPAPTTQTELMLVDTVDKLQQALDELRQAKQIAIDVEHHSYRTFMGITCLVQMSTSTKDYIFDTLTLRDDMHILNLVLTDPKVLKILHGADLDIEWLQRDLSLYIVNMFDTYRAAKALNMARLSLAFLLKHYLDLDVDKSLQLADWRMRPLPQQLIDYARQDTHYLIYVYERMTNDLLQADQAQTQSLRLVYQLSMEVCKKRYTKPYIGPDSHLDLVRKTKRSFDNRQLFALSGIFAWRDMTARMEDESYGYVLPNHMMLQIAESLPREMQGILACCNPIPPLVRQQLHTLHQIVLQAREQPLVKPIQETPSSGSSHLQPTTKDFNSKLNCPHDFSHQEEARDDLPTLLKRSSSGKLEHPAPQATSEASPLPVVDAAFALFQKSSKLTTEEQQRWLYARKENQILCMPYKRYLAILPLMHQQKNEQAAREHKELLNRRLCPTEPAPMPANIKLETAPKMEDDVYNLPLKEQLKRKHQTPATTDQSTAAKRPKQEENMSASKTKAIKKETVASTNEVINVSESDDNDDAVVEVPIEKTAPEIEAPKLSKKQQKRQQHNQRFKAKFRVQSSNRPVQFQANPHAAPEHFDYKNVDFKQFRGGGQRARGTEIKSQMRGKNRPNNRNNKQFNKLFTFSNVRKEGKK